MGYRKDDAQATLFPDPASELWVGMPEYAQDDQNSWKRLVVNFRNEEDYQEFSRRLDLSLTDQSRSVWFPPSKRMKINGVKRYVSSKPLAPLHPIYIVSKGRSDSCVTSRELERRNVPHFVVVEAGERELYESRLGPTATILTLDPQYQRDYETCDELGDDKSTGPGPARNFAWDHAVAAGASWHWVMDDNIFGFYRLNKNVKVPADATVLRCMEDFAGRFENVAMAGPAYHGFTHQREARPPYFLNTRIYSCNLIRNDAPYRWRGRYNEDTDLSLRMLKDGWVTVQFNAFLQHKRATQKMRGGNTDAFYAEEGTLPKSTMLELLHPDCAKVIYRFGRWHHFVDYSRFKANAPRLRPDVVLPDGPNEYGLVYQEFVLDGA